MASPGVAKVASGMVVGGSVIVSAEANIVGAVSVTSSAGSALDAYSSAATVGTITGSVLVGRVPAGTSANLLTLLEGSNSLFQVRNL